jgi:hypothetical protein
MQRWYQPCMQAPKQRKEEAEESLPGCGGEEREAEIVRAPTIHERLSLPRAARRTAGDLTAGGMQAVLGSRRPRGRKEGGEAGSVARSTREESEYMAG